MGGWIEDWWRMDRWRTDEWGDLGWSEIGRWLDGGWVSHQTLAVVFTSTPGRELSKKLVLKSWGFRNKVGVYFFGNKDHSGLH